MNFKNLMKISAVAAVAAFGAGCATTGDLEKVQAQAQSAQTSANDAKATAEQALDAANQAKTLAADANARSMATEEKLNRMFKRSMYK